MTLESLITDLRVDLGKSEEQLPRATAKRMIEKGIVRVNQDMGASYAIVGSDPNETVEPEPTDLDRELILILAAYSWSGIQQRQSAAKAFSWRSGDKAVNRISMASSWKDIAAGLLSYYRQLAGLDDIPDTIGRVAEIGSAL